MPVRLCTKRGTAGLFVPFENLVSFCRAGAPRLPSARPWRTTMSQKAQWTLAGLIVLALAIMAGVKLAQASDVPNPPARERAAVRAPDLWTGFYAGAHGGYGWGGASGSVGSPTTFGPFGYSPDAEGMIYGVHLGAMKQYGGLVLGVEASISRSAMHGAAGVTGAPGIAAGFALDWLGMAEAKAGLEMGRLLPFLTAGGVCGRGNGSVSMTGVGSAASNDATLCGWTVGAGLDYAVTSHLFVTAKYNYLDLGDAQVSFPVAAGVGVSVPVAVKAHVARAGVSLRF